MGVLGNQPTILFVDDEVNVLAALKRGLIDVEYECLFVTSGKEALEIMESREIDVLVTDMRMPEMDGLELLKIVKERWPKTARIVLSGYSQLPQVVATVNQADVYRFILKPWNMEEDLLVALRSALDYNQLLKEKENLEVSLRKKNEVYVRMCKTLNDNAKFEKENNRIRREFLLGVSNYLAGYLKGDRKKEELEKCFSCVTQFILVIDSASAEKNELCSDLSFLEMMEKTLGNLPEVKSFQNVQAPETESDPVVVKPKMLCDLVATVLHYSFELLEGPDIFLEWRTVRGKKFSPVVISVRSYQWKEGGSAQDFRIYMRHIMAMAQILAKPLSYKLTYGEPAEGGFCLIVEKTA